MNHPHIPRTSRLAALGRLWALALPLCLAATGCASFSEMFSEEPQPYTLNTEFSLNVAIMNENWPKDMAKIPLAQQEVLRTLGSPDFVHVWWDRTIPIITSADMHSIMTAQRKGLTPVNISWLYLDKKKEVFFKKNNDFNAVPLDDRLRVLCEVGDPTQMKQFVQQGDKVESWIYYRRGRIYRFVNEKLQGMENTTAVPSYQSE